MAGVQVRLGFFKTRGAATVNTLKGSLSLASYEGVVRCVVVVAAAAAVVIVVAAAAGGGVVVVVVAAVVVGFPLPK